MRKRLLSLFLAAVLMVTVLCPVAYAEGDIATIDSDTYVQDEEISAQTVSGNPTRCGEAGIELIKSFESCYLTAYKNLSSEKYYTIGWGHYGADVTPGMTITQEEADALFIQDLAKFETSLNNFLNKNEISVNQSQYDALLSFTYNLGNVWVSYQSPDFRLRNYLIAGIENYTEAEIRAAFVAWNTAGGKVLAGLTRRRNAECDLFLSEISLPTNPWINSDKTVVEAGGNVTFNFGAANATSYTVEINRAGVETENILSENVNSGKYTATLTKPGYFSVHVVCNNADGSVNTSDIMITVYNDLGAKFTSTILHKEQDKYLENSDTGSVYIDNENSYADQMWYFERQADGTYKISSCYNGKCLTVSGSGVQVQKSNNSDAQKWYVWEESRGYMLKSKSSGKVLNLTNNGQTVTTSLYDGQKTQIWEFDIDEDVVPQKPQMTVTSRDFTTETYFSWTPTYGAKSYNVKIWKGNNLSGEPYRILYDVSPNAGTVLPGGTYIGYVEAYHEYGAQASEPVTFTVLDYVMVSFDANSGTSAPAQQQKYENVDLVLSNTQPTKVGYTFKEWNTAVDGSGKSYAPGAKYTANESATLYAIWIPSSTTLGDLNNDNRVTNADLIVLARITVGLGTAENIINRMNGDMNNDGSITNADIIILARKIVGI